MLLNGKNQKLMNLLKRKYICNIKTTNRKGRWFFHAQKKGGIQLLVYILLYLIGAEIGMGAVYNALIGAGVALNIFSFFYRMAKS